MSCNNCNGGCNGACPPAPTSGCNTCKESQGFPTGSNPAYFFGVGEDGQCYRFAPTESTVDLIQVGEGIPAIETNTDKPIYNDSANGGWWIYNGDAWISTTNVKIVVTGNATPPAGSGNSIANRNRFWVLSNGDTHFIDANGVSMAIFTCAKLKAMMEGDCIANLQFGETINKVFVQNGGGTVRKATFEDFAPKLFSFNLLALPADYGNTAIVIPGWNQTLATDMFWVSRNGVFNTVGTATIDTSPAYLYTWNATGLTLYEALGSSVNSGDEGETFQIICIKRPLP